MGTRTAAVPPDRLVGWLERFEASHGMTVARRTSDTLSLLADEGAAATIDLSGTYPAEALIAAAPEDGAEAVRAFDVIDALSRTAALEGRTGVVLLRRGGYAVGVVEDGHLLTSKTGTRYVQSRTAAGGWSQQRFARRRANQADALVDTVAEHVHRLISGAQVRRLAYGGDKALCAESMRHRLVVPLSSLPKLAFLDVPDPRLHVLQRAARNLNSFIITVSDA